MPEIIISRPELSKTTPEANIAVVDTWIAETADKLNYMLTRLDKEKEAEAEEKEKKTSEVKILDDYDKVKELEKTGYVPDALVIAQMIENFADGCNTIAAAITAGRGNGVGGVQTAQETSPSQMAANIGTVASTNYSQGVTDADGRVNGNSASYVAGDSAGYTRGYQAGFSAGQASLKYEDVEFSIAGQNTNTTTGSHTVSHDIVAACVMSHRGGIGTYQSDGGTGAENVSWTISWSGRTITISEYINGWSQSGKSQTYKVRYYYFE